MESRPTRLLPFLVGSSALGLYLAFPSMRHNFDGVACAIAVELGDFKHLLHGNHLAYGLVGFAFHRLLNLVGLALPALWALQIMDSLCGALGAALFARFLLNRGRPAGVAAAAAMGLAVSNGWWYKSVDAQVYLLAGPFMVLAFEEALKERPRALRLAGLHTAAMLVHSTHALFAPVAVWALLRGHGDGEDGRRAVGRYLAFCFLAVVACYVAAAVLVMRPASLDELNLWLLGSGALGPGRTPIWPKAATLGEGLFQWARSSLRVVSERPAWGLGLWLLAAWGALGARGRLERSAALLWIGAYAMLLVVWEPWNIDYRIMDLLPLWAAASAAVWPAEALHGARALALYAAVLGGTNFVWHLGPVSRPETNPALLKTLWLREALPKDAWVTALSIEEVYIPYFTHRRTLNLRWLVGRETVLRDRVGALLDAGEPVYVTSDHLAQGWETAFAGFGRLEVGRLGEVRLYKLSR